MPNRAARPDPAAMAAGVASPSAQGQATTSTATALSTAEVQLVPSPKMAQATKVMTAMKTTVGTNTPAIWSASRWTGALEDWARSTAEVMRASAVEVPTWVA